MCHWTASFSVISTQMCGDSMAIVWWQFNLNNGSLILRCRLVPFRGLKSYNWTVIGLFLGHRRACYLNVLALSGDRTIPSETGWRQEDFYENVCLKNR